MTDDDGPRRVVLDRRSRLWDGGALVSGGSPWGLVRLAPPARALAVRARDAGPAGVEVSGDADRVVARRLIGRGIAHPLVVPRPPPHPVSVVVPAYGRVDALRRCLAALAGLDVVVVDDGSPRDEAEAIAVLAAATTDARLVVHAHNRGPAAARNTGLAVCTSDLVAFVDSDCVPRQGWLDLVVPHFDDPAVAAVAPRVVPAADDGALLGRFERTRSALDMGAVPALVRHGGRLGFVPTATLVVRRDAVPAGGFDESLRVGEDVDLVWRLADDGHAVRYEPRATVEHAPPENATSWAAHRFAYGTSATVLEARHPGRLAPARLSGWNVATLGLVAAGRPVAALATAATATTVLARRLALPPTGAPASVVARGVASDAEAIGHLLRREWWPVGALALGYAPRSRVARAAALSMLAPVALEWWRQRPALDPVRYTALRLVEDAVYGSGVLVSAARARTVAPLVPRVSLPWTTTRKRS